MGLVDYSDSEEEDLDDTSPAAQKTSAEAVPLPPLPAGFHDLYSSTVRASTQDDPLLHGGRKRVTPHVVGNWPAHVYLEWLPRLQESELLSDLIASYNRTWQNNAADSRDSALYSLLQSDLGVYLPLHISLSRPLTLKTEQKDDFLNDIKVAVASSRRQVFSVRPLNVTWHPNEDRTRWFLVLQLERPAGDELRTLLRAINDVAHKHNQPLLYEEEKATETGDTGVSPYDSFHISIAWSLQPPQSQSVDHDAAMEGLRQRLQALTINFADVKIRAGQDVNAVALQKSRLSMQ